VVPEVRSAALGDVGRLVELYGAAYAELRDMRGGRALLGLSGRPTPVARSFQDQLGDPARSLVVGSDGSNVVGYGSSHTFELIGGERLGAIDELFVLPEARHAGTGRALAASLLDWCRGQGCTGVDAHALPGSRAVKSFFETEGFTARVLVMHRPLT
jgi:GNAT superfamily N-acetyltransferase